MGTVILKQGALQLLFVVVGGNVDGLHIHGVYSRIKHHRRGGSGGGIVVLHLFGGVMIPLEAEGKLQRVLQSRAGMAGHEVGNQILLFTYRFGDLKIPFAEPLVYGKVRFSHATENGSRAMLRGYLQLTADVVSNQLLEECFIFILKQIVKADSRSDKHFFDLWDLFDLLDHM